MGLLIGLQLRGYLQEYQWLKDSSITTACQRLGTGGSLRLGIGSTLHSPQAAPWAESFQVAHSFWDFSTPLGWFLHPLGNSVCLILSLHSSYCSWMLGEGRAKETLILSETFRSYSVVYPEFKALPCPVECFPPLRLSDCLTSVLMLCVNKLPRGRSFCFIFPWTTCSLMWFPPR